METTNRAVRKWVEMFGLIIVLLLLLTFIENGQIFYGTLLEEYQSPRVRKAASEEGEQIKEPEKTKKTEGSTRSMVKPEVRVGAAAAPVKPAGASASKPKSETPPASDRKLADETGKKKAAGEEGKEKARPRPRAQLEEPSLGQQVVEFIRARSRIIAASIFFAGICVMLVRMLFARRIMEFVYLESQAAEKRTYLGFLINVLAVILQIGLLYGIVHMAKSPYPVVLPIMLGLLLAANALWLLYVYLFIGKADRRAVRGTLLAALCSAVVCVVVLAAVWVLESAKGVAHLARHPLETRAMTGWFCLALGAVDAGLQTLAYGKGKRIGLIRVILTVIIALVLVGLGVLVSRACVVGKMI